MVTFPTPHRRLVCLLLAVFLVPVDNAAQDSPSPLPGVFGEILDVRVVNLEVVVTDRDGVPVRGLRPQDFILEVDGEEVPIDYFSEIRGGLAVEVESAEGEPRLAAAPEVVPGSRIGTSYLLYIDDFFSIARDRNRVLDSLIEDLPLIGPEDRMAVVAYDGDALEMLTTWTHSITTLERVLKKAKLRRSHGLKRLAETRQFNFDALLAATNQFEAFGSSDFFRTQLTPIERYYVSRLTEQVERSVAAATATLRSFAQPPGRKAMILLSGGWPFLPAEFLGPNSPRFILDTDTNRGEALFRPLSDTANLLSYTLYSVDVPGLSGGVALGADVAGPDLATTLGQTVGPATSFSFQREQSIHYTLDFLADETGGKPFINAKRSDVFEEVVADTRSYYWIGFSPQREWDDQRHDIEVRVGDPRLRVRSREGFLDSSHQHEVRMAVESTLLFGSPPGEQGSLQVALGEPRKAGRGRMEVPLTVQVPVDQVTFVPVGDLQVTRLELLVAVQDEEGGRADIPMIPLALQASRPAGSGETVPYEVRLRLRRLSHQLVVALYDPTSGRIFSTTAEIRP